TLGRGTVALGEDSGGYRRRYSIPRPASRSRCHLRLAYSGRSATNRLTADIVAKRFFASRRATLIQKIDPPRKIDSSGAPIGFESCALGGGRRLLQQNRHKADMPTAPTNVRYWE